MFARITFLLLGYLGVAGVLACLIGSTIKKFPLSPTSPASGEDMFRTYCAACHNKDCKGAGWRLLL
jgi:cytochrome c